MLQFTDLVSQKRANIYLFVLSCIKYKERERERDERTSIYHSSKGIPTIATYPNHSLLQAFQAERPFTSASQNFETMDSHTVDGRNPAPVDMVNIPLLTGFHTCWVVQNFFHQQYFSEFSFPNLQHWILELLGHWEGNPETVVHSASAMATDLLWQSILTGEQILTRQKLTYPLKHDGWKTNFPFEMVPFLQDMSIVRWGGSYQTSTFFHAFAKRTQRRFTSWWFRPLWKILVKLHHFSNYWLKIKNYLKPPPSHGWL